MASGAEEVCDWESEVQWTAGQFFVPSWALPIEWVNLTHDGCGDLFDSDEQGYGPVARFSFCEGCAQDRNECCESQCECFGGSLRDSMMPVSQRHGPDSVDTAGFSEYEKENVSVSEFSVHGHQIDHEIDCWSVSSAQETARTNIFLHEIKVKFGGMSRSISTPWCWKAEGRA